LVDADGQPITAPVENSDKVFIKTVNGQSGKATITADAEWMHENGRIYVGEGNVKTQALAVPQVAKETKQVTATGEWTFTPPSSPTPTPSAPGQGGQQLPTTGNNVAGVILAGSLMLLVGSAAVFIVRRRRAVNSIS
jgi:LPXTG-motif cell wall-anchored protein